MKRRYSYRVYIYKKFSIKLDNIIFIGTHDIIVIYLNNIDEIHSIF